MKKLKMLLMMLFMLVFASGCIAANEPAEDGKSEGLVLYEDEEEEVRAEELKSPDDKAAQAEAAEDEVRAEDEGGAEEADQASAVPEENGVYTSVEDVALYIHTYGKLPGNFITKKEAKKLGWTGGSLEDYAPGKCIGGDRFGNYEGLLPDKDGRIYYECDIDTTGTSGRGAKRIVFSNDGLVYYTADHYKTFEKLY